MTDELAELFRRIDASLAEALAQPPKPVLDDPSALADALDRGLAPHGLCVDRRRGLELTGDTVQVPLRPPFRDLLLDLARSIAPLS